ncbi:hypothetical protein OG883_33295 [Streptomyces sp. NBC_01142]|uniref:hypothetical protein n=1 Tax=Streptomyces sp. NBC_01142 TaxID=2975865 RepID=UPI0022511E10|nr:hypothetical protein [Streptomyces sp. NBC_01142]MCX4824646.1 hypothetical protein [Streptomyces sp. NBC_01142]
MTGAERERRSRKPRWIRVSVTVLAVCSLPVACIVWLGFVMREAGESQQVECAEAMRFVGGSLPEGARDEKCGAAHWMDTQYTATFRMPGSDVAGWLAKTFPGHEPRNYCEKDVCLDVQYGDPEAPSGAPDGADVVNLTVVHEDGDTALVDLIAFTV